MSIKCQIESYEYEKKLIQKLPYYAFTYDNYMKPYYMNIIGKQIKKQYDKCMKQYNNQK